MRTQGYALKWSIQFGSEKQSAKSAKAKCSKLVNAEWSKALNKLLNKVPSAHARGRFDISNVFPPGVPRVH